MKKSKVLMIVGAFLLMSLFVFPMWQITLEAPQYPEPLGMNIWLSKFTGVHPNDIKNINIMNHYVGMKEIPETIPEFEIFPVVIGIMTFAGILFGVMGWRKLYLPWFISMVILGSIGMYDFYMWEYDYGHDLKATAAIQFTDENGEPMAYQPPLIGSKKILNFVANSYPRTGAYLMFLGMLMSLFAFFVSKKELIQNE